MEKPYLVDLQNALSQNIGLLPDERQLEKYVTETLVLFEESAELTIRIVEKDEIQILNQQYRGKDKPTNVLSFPADSHDSLTFKLLGDLIICAEVVKDEAIEQHKTYEQHLAHMVVHGCLHLLGYDHIEPEDAEEMESLEIEVMEKLGFANPYLID